MKRNLSMLLLSFVLWSCSNIPSKPVCTELGPDRAYCVNTLETKGFYWDNENLLDGKTYWEERNKCIRLPPSTWAAIKSYLIKDCRNQGGCSELKRTVDLLDKSLTQ